VINHAVISVLIPITRCTARASAHVI
jgi:hypothetical protein